MTDKAKQEAHTTFPNKFEAFYVVAALIAGEILVSFALRDSSLLDAMDWQGASGFITVVANGLAFIVLLTYKQMSYRALFHPTSRSALGTLTTLSLPIFLIVPGLVLLTSALNSLVGWLFPMSDAEMEMFDEMVAIGAIPIFFSCIAAPLLEEMLFRGIILRSFLQQYSRTTALLWSSLLFALAHLNAYQFFTALILGVVLGWLYERTRSLWPSILLHAAFNSFVTFLVNAETLGPLPSVTWVYASAFVCALIGGRILLRILEPPAVRPKKTDGD